MTTNTDTDAVECGERYTLRDYGGVVVDDLHIDLRALISPEPMGDGAKVYFTTDDGAEKWATLEEFMRQAGTDE